jgi:hypothetical protein
VEVSGREHRTVFNGFPACKLLKQSFLQAEALVAIFDQIDKKSPFFPLTTRGLICAKSAIQRTCWIYAVLAWQVPWAARAVAIPNDVCRAYCQLNKPKLHNNEM